MLHIAIKRLRFRQRRLMGKNGIGMAGRQLFAVIGGPGLKNNRSPLRRAGNIERAGNLEKSPRWSRVCSLFLSKNCPLALLRTKASSSQESHNPFTTRKYSSAIR
jgi:hypothetical protein